jgi:hypothetical protein
MHWIFDEIKNSLDDLAPRLFLQGRGKATLSVHDEIELLASRYAGTMDLGFLDEDAEIPVGNPNRYLCVCREARGSSRMFPSTQGLLLYDHCWLTFYNDDVTEQLARTGEPLGGYLLRCELVMEVEFDFAENVAQHLQDLFHRDFQKIVIAKAPLKIFIFRSRSPAECKLTMSALETQIHCFEYTGLAEEYLLSCWCNGEFTHQESSR